MNVRFLSTNVLIFHIKNKDLKGYKKRMIAFYSLSDKILRKNSISS